MEPKPLQAFVTLAMPNFVDVLDKQSVQQFLQVSSFFSSVIPT
jgi:hypothetical protein